MSRIRIARGNGIPTISNLIERQIGATINEKLGGMNLYVNNNNNIQNFTDDQTRWNSNIQYNGIHKYDGTKKYLEFPQQNYSI